MLERLATLLGRRVHVRGVDRAIRRLFPCHADTSRFVVGVRRRGDGLLVEVDSRQWIDWNLVFRGTYEPHMGQLFERLLPRGAVAVDVGANVGAHALSLAVMVGPTGLVLAVEPNPPIRERLERNIALNGLGQICVCACALGATEARMPLRVPALTSSEAVNPGMASLVALDTPHDVVEVHVRTLDAVVAASRLQRVDVVKIDVQGYELPVLRGMNAVIERFRPAVVFEYESWAWERVGAALGDALEVFGRHRYSLWRIDSKHGLGLAALMPGRSIGDHAEILAMGRDDARTAGLEVAMKGAGDG